MGILFITSTRVGDAVLSTGLLKHLIDGLPGAPVTVACGAQPAPLFEAVPNLERIIVLDKMLFSLHWVSLWAQCVGRRWQAVVDLRNTPMSYLLLADRRWRIGPPSRGQVHRVERLARVLGVAGEPPSPHIWVAQRHREAARRLIPDGPPVLAVGPTANWPAKTWRGEQFAELIRRLTAAAGILPGARVAVFGREDERPLALRLIESLPAERRLDLVGRIDLLTAFACIERSAFYVGNDSGLMHLAAASGVPTLGLFGPSPEVHYAPWGPLCAVARGRLSYENIFPEDFNYLATDSLMDSLTVDAAEAAARQLWRRALERAA
jgi:ADP-heptose:LPS heptosyltransferase